MLKYVIGGKAIRVPGRADKDDASREAFAKSKTPSPPPQEQPAKPPAPQSEGDES